MNYYLNVHNTGRILGFVKSTIAPPPLGSSDNVIEVDADYSTINLSELVFDNGKVSRLSPRPSEHHQFNYTTKQWEDPRTLDDLKAAKNAAITARRVREDMRFEFGGKWFQADEAAWKQISGTHGWVAAQNSMPPGWPGQWKAEDNTFMPIPDPATWWQFYGAVLARGSSNFMRGEQLKAQLAAATTPAEVEAVPDW